jgi:hypothetical protein
VLARKVKARNDKVEGEAEAEADSLRPWVATGDAKDADEEAGDGFGSNSMSSGSKGPC